MFKKLLVQGIVFTFFCSQILAADNESTDSTKRLLRLLNDGDHLALMRHALAPGGGDPLEFEIKDCSTQRNLDERGRHQAEMTGKFIADVIEEEFTVYSSQWCRCLDTATLLGIGSVKELPYLNSFFQQPEKSDSQTNLLKEWLRNNTNTSPVMLVTHQVNITALTGIFPSSGEIVIVKKLEDGALLVVDTLQLIEAR